MPFSTPRRALASAVAIAGACLLVALGGSYGIALYAVQRSDSNWCAALVILTEHWEFKTPPSDPADNPSRVANYQFYLSLTGLERKFGC